MKRTFYLLISLIGLALIGVTNRGHAQSAIHGTTQIHSGGHIGVYNSLSFVSGYVVTPRNEPTANILWTAGATYSGASNSSHVNGYAEKAGTDAFMFPVGDGTKLRMAGISAPASAGNYRAAYFSTSPASATAPTGSPFPVTNRGTGVTGVSTAEYWDIDGAGAVNLTLSWDAGSSVSALSGGIMNRLVVVGYNTATSKWESLGNAGGVTGTMSTTGTVTANAVTPNNYSAFTFGAFGSLPNLPNFDTITLPSNATAVISVTPTGGTLPYSYSICGTTPSSSGTATVSNTGVVTFIPVTSFTGSVSVCLSVCDSSTPQNCNTTTIPFLVTNGGGNLGTTSPVSSYTIIIPGDPSGVTSNTLVGSGGTAPLTYAIVSCQTGSAASTSTQGGAVTINATTGAYSYTAPAGFSGTDYFCVKVCDSGNPQTCSVTTIGVRVPAAAGSLVSAKVFLAGPYSTATSLMNDNLRTKGLIPSTDPYNMNTTVASSVLAITGNKAVVDWVMVDLRSGPTTIVASKAALLLRDGSVVAPDGTSPVSFSLNGSYHVSVRHRNHLGVLTATALPLTSTATMVDFTQASTATYANTNTTSQRTIGSVRAMWAGNAVDSPAGVTEIVKYTGSNADVPGVTQPVPTGSIFLANIYSRGDTNMDGDIRLTGSASDKTVISNSIISSPNNSTGGLALPLYQSF